MNSDYSFPVTQNSTALDVQKYPPILSPEEEYELAINLYEKLGFVKSEPYSLVITDEDS